MRYLLIGLGGMGQKRKAALGERCVATVDPVNAEADFTTPDACDPDRFEAVVLAVPNQAKLSLVERFLRQGKHVLIEKPLVLPDRTTADRLQQLARQHRAIWYTSYNHRFEPLVARLRQWVDQGAIGPIYYGRLFYGNGTVGNVLGTWREQGLGVIEDLGSHLLDLAGFLFGYQATDFVVSTAECHESTSFDHAVLTSVDHRLSLEMSYLSWRNTFTIDVFGGRGSLHLSGLAKWGPTHLSIRRRILPSGVPDETTEAYESGDVTWEHDLTHFETLTQRGETSVDNDWSISRCLHAVA